MDADVIIVGGGPAGPTLGTLVAAAGHSCYVSRAPLLLSPRAIWASGSNKLMRGCDGGRKGTMR
jgi:ribulose 1,5-bisphosphate synthetase/thiazole synthase